VRIGCAGKLVSAFDIARAMALGADWCNSARGFMFALGCIQAQACHTGQCPTGVTTQDAKRQHRGADGSAFTNQLVHQGAVRCQIVGVELDRVHSPSPGRAHRRNLVVESVSTAGCQHDRRPWGESSGEFNADLAAAAENHHHPAGRVGRVFHGCDYSLR
jgi:hypothetical protein